MDRGENALITRYHDVSDFTCAVSTIPRLFTDSNFNVLGVAAKLVSSALSATKETATMTDLEKLKPGDRVGPGGEYVVVPVELVALVSDLIESDSDHQTEWDEDAKRLLAALKEQDK